MRFRRWYYDRFSSFYDGFIRLHSGDRRERMRSFLAKTARIEPGHTVADLCTGTGSSALRMADASGAFVVGIDFSPGMLRQAHRKSMACSFHGPAPAWVEADAQVLPVRSDSVDRVTCAYAMYELPGPVRDRVLRESLRILKPGGMFIMMEHLPPKKPFIKLLYLVRIHLVGTRGVRAFAGREEDTLSQYFEGVDAITAEGGRTRAVFGYKPAGEGS